MTQLYIGSGNHAPQGKLEEFEQPADPWTPYADREATGSPLYPTEDVNVPPASVSGQVEGEERITPDAAADTSAEPVSDNDSWTSILRAHEVNAGNSPAVRIGSIATKLISNGSGK